MPASGGLALMELRRPIETQPVAQNLRCVLSQQRRWDPDGAGPSVDLPRGANLGDAPRLRMLDLDRHVTLHGERAGKRLVDVENRAAGNPELLEPLEPVPPPIGSQAAFDSALEPPPRPPPRGRAARSALFTQPRS